MDPDGAAASNNSFPPDLKARADQYLGCLKSLLPPEASDIGAMDEIFLHFKTEKSASSRGKAFGFIGGMKDARAALVIGATADGRLLRPLLILKVHKIF